MHFTFLSLIAALILLVLSAAIPSPVGLVKVAYILGPEPDLPLGRRVDPSKDAADGRGGYNKAAEVVALGRGGYN